MLKTKKLPASKPYSSLWFRWRKEVSPLRRVEVLQALARDPDVLTVLPFKPDSKIDAVARMIYAQVKGDISAETFCAALRERAEVEHAEVHQHAHCKGLRHMGK